VIDVHVLESTFHEPTEDGACEKFFEAVPGFLSSKLVNGVKDHGFRETFGQALGGFLDRTFSVNSVTELARGGRLVICLNAAHAALGVNGISQIFTDIISGRWPELLQSVEIGHALRRWRNSTDKQVTWDVRRIVAQIVVGVREHDDRWISLVKTEYGIAGHVLREYIGHGDSVLLSILIHMTHKAFHTRSWTPWILSSLAEFNIRDTFPELQHAFCELWNDIVLEAWNGEGPENIPVRILRDIRHAYIALHEDADAVLMTFSSSTHHFDPVLRLPRSYRVCKIAGHRQSLTLPTPFTRSITVPSNVIVESPPTADHAPRPNHAQESISPPSAANSVSIAQAASIIGPSVPESIGTVVTRASYLLVADGASHDPRQQPALPAAEIAGIATIVQPDDPTPQLQISELGDTTQAPAPTSAHPDSVPTPIPLSSRPLSSFVPDPGDGPDTLQPTTFATMLSYPPGNNEQQKVTVPCASLDTNEVPSTDNPTPWSTPPTIVVSDSLSSRVLHPVAKNPPSSSLESAPVQFDHILDTPIVDHRSHPKQYPALAFLCRLLPFRSPRSTSIGNLPTRRYRWPQPYRNDGTSSFNSDCNDVVSNVLPLEARIDLDKSP
jgi:hypothetical protein